MRYHNDWHDMSPWLVHFTSGKRSASSYDQMMGILFNGVIEAGDFGEFKNKAPISLPKTVCFSEIPPEYWKRLAAHRKSEHGIGFTKEFIVNNGGNPILYVWPETLIHRSITRLAQDHAKDASSPFWQVAAFIQIQKPGNSWDWEREWRVPNILPFSPSDVAFLIIPEKLHSSATDFFDNAFEGHIGPSYRCPFIDATWEMARIKEAIDAKKQS